MRRALGGAVLVFVALATARAWAEPSLAPKIAAALDDEADGPLSKKSAVLREKAERPPARALVPLEEAAESVITLHSIWNKEFVPISRSRPLSAELFAALARCHYTNQASPMDERLLEVILRAAARFGARTIDIVSGFRAPKYQLMLRKKGHEVARDSEHPRGHALDFRLPEVPTRILLKFVRSLHLGGVGYYPDSNFVHADVGRVRFWRGH